LSTLRSVSSILVLDGGRVVEHGTHDELLQRRGLYWQLHSVQTGQGDPLLEPLEPEPVTAA
jgi:ATP-binding cassette subfamily B protein